MNESIIIQNLCSLLNLSLALKYYALVAPDSFESVCLTFLALYSEGFRYFRVIT